MEAHTRQCRTPQLAPVVCQLTTQSGPFPGPGLSMRILGEVKKESPTSCGHLH